MEEVFFMGVELVFDSYIYCYCKLSVGFLWLRKS